MTAHVWMAMNSMLMASLATVNYNNEKPFMLPLRVFQIRQLTKPSMLLKRCMLQQILSISSSLVSQPLRFAV